MSVLLGACGRPSASPPTKATAPVPDVATQVVNDNKVRLRIMGVGDSITYGYGGSPSNQDNSYRRFLKDRLTAEGHAINFVGTQQSGTTGAHEGYPGAEIDGIAGTLRSNNAVKHYAPNLILLMAGTNDVGRSVELNNAPARLGSLIVLGTIKG